MLKDRMNMQNHEKQQASIPTRPLRLIERALKRLKTSPQHSYCTFCDVSFNNITINTAIPVCPACFNELPWCEQKHTTLGELAAFYYEAPVSHYILAGKIAGQLDKLHILGQLLATHIGNTQPALPAALLPVPLHPKRLRERGFNQSIELARPIAKHFKLPILSGHVVRKRHTADQKALTEPQRKKNMSDAFSIHKTIPYQHIAILDDVVTTGSTCSALKTLLMEHGVKKVDIWCCATTKQ